MCVCEWDSKSIYLLELKKYQISEYEMVVTK